MSKPKTGFSIQNAVSLVQFQHMMLKAMPSIAMLELTPAQWSTLNVQFNQEGRKRLSAVFILNQLMDILDISHDQLMHQLKKSMPRETGKTHSPQAMPPNLRRRYRIPARQKDQLILESTENQEKLATPLKKIGIRKDQLTASTPTKNYGELKKTPGQNKYRPVYSNEHHRLFKKITPKTDKVRVRSIDPSTLQQALPKLKQKEPAKPVHFTATRSKILEHARLFRRYSQQQLTGARCKDVFLLHAKDQSTIRIQGNQHHWSHLIAHFLGGKASKNNLVPSTAAANYNILEQVESFIAKKLLKGVTEHIDITVEPFYRSNTLIADELVFHLSWQEKNPTNQKIVSKSETININPRSYERASDDLLEIMDTLRNLPPR